MGYGSYNSSDWTKLQQSRNINDAAGLHDIYTASKMKDIYNPALFTYRESFDSPDNPFSTPIIFGLDVTGSMGYLSEAIAKGALNRTMVEIYDKQPVTNPHIMFNAIGDSLSDTSPLQATQFEADIRIVEQLLDIWFENGGGGNGGESYLLTWYLAAKKTKIDSFDKRGKKGFIFTIGDERCHKRLTSSEIQRVFGMQDRDYTAAEIYSEASKRYRIFHITIKAGSCIYQHSDVDWKKLIGTHAIDIEKQQVELLPQIFVSLMQISNGMDILSILSQWDVDTRIVIESVLRNLAPQAPHNLTF